MAKDVCIGLTSRMATGLQAAELEGQLTFLGSYFFSVSKHYTIKIAPQESVTRNLQDTLRFLSVFK